MVCSECDREAKARGLCVVHYSRFMRYGRTTKKEWCGHIDKDGYRIVPVVGEPRGKREHILKAEIALGKKLPAGVHVHHVNEDRSDNRNENLVICQDVKYHKLLHTRTEALKATGDANKRKCIICKQWDSPELLGSQIRHKKCHAEYMKGRNNA